MTRPDQSAPPRRGGPRPGAGRPPAYAEPLLRKTVTLPASYVRQLQRAGAGNLSDGIRLVLECARTPSGGFWLDSPSGDPRAD